MKKFMLSLSQMIAIVAISTVVFSSCKKEDDPIEPPVKEVDITIEGLTIGSSHALSSDKTLFVGSGSGMVEGEKILVPNKIKDVEAYLKKQDEPTVILNLLNENSKKRMIGLTDFNAPKHFHPAIPADQKIGKYDLYFKITDENGDSKEEIIKDVEIKSAPFSVDLGTISFGSKEGEKDNKLVIGKEGFITISNTKCEAAGTTFKSIGVYLQHADVGSVLIVEIKDEIAGKTSIDQPTTFKVKVPTEAEKRDGTKVALIEGEYTVNLRYQNNLGQGYAFKSKVNVVK